MHSVECTHAYTSRLLWTLSERITICKWLNCRDKLEVNFYNLNLALPKRIDEELGQMSTKYVNPHFRNLFISTKVLRDIPFIRINIFYGQRILRLFFIWNITSVFLFSFSCKTYLSPYLWSRYTGAVFLKIQKNKCSGIFFVLSYLTVPKVQHASSSQEIYHNSSISLQRCSFATGIL